MDFLCCKEEDHEAKKDDPVERNTLKDFFKGMNGNQWGDDWGNDKKEN